MIYLLSSFLKYQLSYQKFFLIILVIVTIELHGFMSNRVKFVVTLISTSKQSVKGSITGNIAHVGVGVT